MIDIYRAIKHGYAKSKRLILINEDNFYYGINQKNKTAVTPHIVERHNHFSME